MFCKNNFESIVTGCKGNEISSKVEVGKSKFIVGTPFEAIECCFSPNCYLVKIKVIGGLETAWINSSPQTTEIVGDLLKLGDTSLPISLIEQVIIRSKVEDVWDLGVIRKETSSYKVTTTYLSKLLSPDTLALLNEYFKLG